MKASTEERAVPGTETAGGITSRRGSFGRSWWTPWTNPVQQRAEALLGPKRNSTRWTQYSTSPQEDPAGGEQADQGGVRGAAAVRTTTISTTITGMKMISGTADGRA